MAFRLSSRVLVLSCVIACASSSRSSSTTPTPAPPTTTPAATATPEPPAGDAGFKVPRFQRTNIGDSELSAYLPVGFPAFDLQKSPDGSSVYTADMTSGGFHYAVVAVRFVKEAVAPTPEAAEDMVVHYLDFLKTQFNITGAVGYGRGRTMASDANVHGVLDYWTDKDGAKWTVEAWTNQTSLIVMLIYGDQEYPSVSAAQMYLEGARFSPAP
jgi:hypothetical protein